MDDRTVIVEGLDRTRLLPADPGAQARAEKPDRPCRGWLTIWSGPQRGADFPLHEGRNFVGSDALCRPRVGDPALADFSFNIRICGDNWQMIDLDSDDGILRNGDPSFRCALQDEDWLKCGEILFRVKKL